MVIVLLGLTGLDFSDDRGAGQCLRVGAEDSEWQGMTLWALGSNQQVVAVQGQGHCPCFALPFGV